MNQERPSSAGQPLGSHFRTTHWSLVLAAGGSSSPQAVKALDELCRTYWNPLYFYIRRRGNAEHDAKDLTQGFFAELLRRESLGQVTPGPAKFRSFLLASLNNFLADEHARATALKRGGGQSVISFDAQEAEQSYQLEPVDGATPESLFDRQWAVAVLNSALMRLEQEFVQSGRAALFQSLRGHIVETAPSQSYAEIAVELGTTEEAVKKSAQRLRRRFQEVIREEIGATGASPAEIEEELRYLGSVISK
jgi:RNA polymerase sigma-70 factor (ECF subfamily)